MSDNVQWESFGSPSPQPASAPQGAAPAPHQPAPAPQQRPLPKAAQPAVAIAALAAARPALLIKNSLKVKVVVGFVLLHLAVVIWLGQQNAILLVAWVAYCVISMSTAAWAYRRELGNSTLVFNKNFALRSLGANMLEFQHVFSHQDQLLDELRQEIDGTLSKRGLLPHLDRRVFVDLDRDLSSHEGRPFYVASSLPTARGTTVSLALYTGAEGQSKSIEWWILVSGFVDPNKLLAFVAAAPIYMPFWLRPYLRRNFDVLQLVRTVHAAFYNNLDVVAKVRFLHATLLDVLVDFLDARGIDTSDLRVQRAQVLNVNVSGGQAQFGAVMQGAFNRISTLGKGSRFGKPT